MLDYEIDIDNFNGPLDLLLDLVKDKKIDILDINIYELTSAYLKIIENLETESIDIAGEYLVMAATLLQLKSKMILHTPEENAQLEEDKQVILQRLAEYQKFKNTALVLREKETERKNIFIKEKDDLNKYQKEIDDTILDGTSDPIKLIMILRKMFERTYAVQLRQTTVEAFNLSPKDRAIEIHLMLKVKDELSFEEVFFVPTLKHFVVTLLALLDMSRMQEINLSQKDQFGIIKVTRGELYV
jgi:segregation and condensation protein A